MVFKYLFFIFTLLVISAKVSYGSPLEKAWQEYDYQNFSGALKLFKEVAKQPSSNASTKMSARFGEALVTHYRIPGQDPKKAIDMYKSILFDAKDDKSFDPALYLNIGKAYRTFGDKSLDSASLWFSNLLKKYPGSIYAHEAALETAYILSFKQTHEDFIKTINYLTEYCKSYPQNPFASTMYLFNGTLALGIKNYRLARDQLVLADSMGVVNIRRRPTTVYQIAYLSDKKLNDPACANKYYTKLINNYASDQRVMYSKNRLAYLKDQP